MAKEGTKENPWKLKTPPMTSDYEMYQDEKDGQEVIVCVVGKTTLLYDYRCLNDLHNSSRIMATGWNLAALMNRSLPKMEQWKLGAVRKKIPSVVGMD